MKLFAIYLITDGEFQEVWLSELNVQKTKEAVTVFDCLKENRLQINKATRLEEGKGYPKALLDLVAIDDSKISKEQAMTLLEETLEQHRQVWEGERLTLEESLAKQTKPEEGEIIAELDGS